ncbi:anthranilate synthase component I family protein [Candidatus Gracilibacteria bacterium]|nr:anthranilate synthase component I family protein [Candidatus Gracilibacteria bacterium]
MYNDFLNPDFKNLCWLNANGRNILAYNPIDKFVGSDINKFKKFAKKHSKHKLIGYFSYDLAYQLHKIKQTATDDLELPLIYFLAFDKWHEDFTLPQAPSTPHTSTNFAPTMSAKEYAHAYKQIKSHITDGNIYQINLTHRLEAQTDLAPRELFLKTIAHNPVNYSAYIEGDGFQILSASPEHFLTIKDNKISTSPVKGTRPRGKTPAQDAKLKKELLESPKETAELNMITDLLRNDLGKIAKTNSVTVDAHRLFSQCPTVWHTYSQISAELAADPLEALISTLPGGSITGCPKHRAMQIIDQLEPTTRGIYTGNIGYIDGDELDFNIAIRTIIKKGQKLHLQVGGGIVLDSTEESEYQETLDKAKSFMKIIHQNSSPKDHT